MSWMDSWSRPSKHAVTPPPLYLTAGEAVPFCHSCGRVIGPRKSHAGQEIKYCSTRCRNNKPGSVDRKIEAAFAALLDGRIPIGLSEKSTQAAETLLSERKSKKKVKGDPRIIVECGEVERLVFEHEKDPEKVFGRKKNRKARGVRERPEDWRSVDMVDDPEPNPPVTEDDADLTLSDASVTDGGNSDGGIPLEPAHEYGYGGGKIRPPQEMNDVNGSIGGEKGWAERLEETEDMKSKRREGQKKADEREMVRKAARRGCAFGFLVQELEKDSKIKDLKQEVHQRRKCEAIMKSAAVEASFAKGEWGIRWREKN